MSTSTASTIVETFVTDVTGILYAIIPPVLVAVAIFFGLRVGVRYAMRWVGKAAK